MSEDRGFGRNFVCTEPLERVINRLFRGPMNRSRGAAVRFTLMMASLLASAPMAAVYAQNYPPPQLYPGYPPQGQGYDQAPGYGGAPAPEGHAGGPPPPPSRLWLPRQAGIPAPTLLSCASGKPVNPV